MDCRAARPPGTGSGQCRLPQAIWHKPGSGAAGGLTNSSMQGLESLCCSSGETTAAHRAGWVFGALRGAGFGSAGSRRRAGQRSTDRFHVLTRLKNPERNCRFQRGCNQYRHRPWWQRAVASHAGEAGAEGFRDPHKIFGWDRHLLWAFRQATARGSEACGRRLSARLQRQRILPRILVLACKPMQQEI